MNGFDSIINTLDKHLEPKPYVSPSDPFPNESEGDVKPAPVFNVGDVIVIRETRWPPKTGKVNLRTGLYSDPGFPQLGNLRYAQQADEISEFNMGLHFALQERLNGHVTIGDKCKVIAVWCHDDGKKYYFIDNGKKDGKGWTRCGYRFRHVDEDQRRQR